MGFACFQFREPHLSIMPMTPHNLVGRTFGHLTVIAPGASTPGRVRWTCQCVCGTVKDVLVGALRQGSTKSCGCRRNTRLADLTGQVFGRLTVLGPAPMKNGRSRWSCKCECGAVKDVYNDQLKGGRVKSCGCLEVENRIKHGHMPRGIPVPPEYRAWQNMKGRVRAKVGSVNYENYQKRGITVCERWLSFPNFLEDMGPRPTPKHSVERVDNDRGYEKSNCIWALRAVQNRNHRRNVNLTLDGVTLCLTDWSERLGIKYGTLQVRIRAGYSTEQILSTSDLRKGNTGKRKPLKKSS